MKISDFLNTHEVVSTRQGFATNSSSSHSVVWSSTPRNDKVMTYSALKELTATMMKRGWDFDERSAPDDIRAKFSSTRTGQLDEWTDPEAMTFMVWVNAITDWLDNASYAIGYNDLYAFPAAHIAVYGMGPDITDPVMTRGLQLASVELLAAHVKPSIINVWDMTSGFYSEGPENDFGADYLINRIWTHAKALREEEY